MLAALLLAGMVAAPLGSALLFLPAKRRLRAAGAWPAIRRFALAVVGTAVLGAAVAGVLKLAHASQHNFVVGVASVVIASLIWMPVTRRWNAGAHLCWASSIFLFVTYLVFALEWTFASDHGVRVPVGNLRRPRNRALDEAGHPAGPVRCARCRTAHGQPARAGSQRAAGHGDRYAPV